MGFLSLDYAHMVSLTSSWLSTHGAAIVLIVVLAAAVHFFGRFFLDKAIRRMVPRSRFATEQDETQREDTLIRITHGTLNVLVWVLAFLMVLSEVGINITPLLAAAGVAGIAVGFGGQYLIRDIVAGLFIIFENQYRVGDVVCLDDTCGLVEDVSIRMATLRDLDGTVHHVPHGVVSRVANLSKEFARVNLNIGVSYASNLDEVIRVANKVGVDMTTDSDWKDKMLGPIKFERVDSLSDSAIEIKVLGDTKPLEQWAVAGEYRKRIKLAFDAAGIDIPFPQQTIHIRPAPPGMS